MLEFAEKTKVSFVVDGEDLEVDGAETKAVAAYEPSDKAKELFRSRYPDGGWATDRNEVRGR